MFCASFKYLDKVLLPLPTNSVLKNRETRCHSVSRSLFGPNGSPTTTELLREPPRTYRLSAPRTARRGRATFGVGQLREAGGAPKLKWRSVTSCGTLLGVSLACTGSYRSRIFNVKDHNKEQHAVLMGG